MRLYLKAPKKLEELRVVAVAEEPCGFAGEVAEDVHADREVRRVQDRDPFGGAGDLGLAGLVEAGRTGHVGDARVDRGAQVGERRGRDREIDRDAAPLERALRIVLQRDALRKRRADAFVSLAFEGPREDERGLAPERRANLEAHAAFGAHDHDSGSITHFRIPTSFKTSFSRSRFGSVIGVIGRRISSSHQPSAAHAAFTGIGFVSQKRASKSGSSA